jgi:hypothetical protein
LLNGQIPGRQNITYYMIGFSPEQPLTAARHDPASEGAVLIAFDHDNEVNPRSQWQKKMFAPHDIDDPIVCMVATGNIGLVNGRSHHPSIGSEGIRSEGSATTIASYLPLYSYQEGG